MTKLRIGSLFSGIGGLDLAVEEFFGAETAWHCEWEAEPSKVLAARWPGVPNLHDVTKVDWANVEPVDIMCGGFPCQDVSLAGRRRGMKEGTRSGLWAEFARAIDIVRPSVVVIENVRGLLSADAGGDVEPCPWCMGDGADEYHLRALDAVLADLSDLGFDAEWTGLRAADVGAPHGRFRFFLLAYARGEAREFWAGFRAGEAGRLGRGRPDHAVRSDGADLKLLPTPIVSDLKGGADRSKTRLYGGAQFAPQLREIAQLLPPPSAGSFNESEPVEAWVARRERVKEEIGNGNGFGMPLGVAVRLLPTPVTEPDTGNGHARNLGKEVKLLPTPTARDEAASGGSSASDVTLTDAVVRTELGKKPNPRLLPTPVGTNASGNQHNNRGEALLPGVARELMPTPQVADSTGGHASRSGDRSGELLLPGLARELTVDWGPYAPAVRLWESLTRPAPAPTLPDGKNGNHRLAAVFPEWMMGYPAGWVTDIIGRNAAIKACGNGVVPQQAFAGLAALWHRVIEGAARC